jgi:WD40 repeat protein
MAREQIQNSVTPASRPRPVVPEHESLRRIGEGAYGEVWLARSKTGALRAVKVVHRSRFADERPYEREFNGITKFEPLSRSAEGLVDILQVGRDDAAGFFYYVMELADPAAGESRNCASKPQGSFEPPFSQDPEALIRNYRPRTLDSDLSRCGRLPFQECVQLGLSISLALGHLHRHGLLHRDVKPSNIIFVGGLPKLADIGLVTELAEARSYVGTEGFIPPDGPNSAQADLYSLGKVLYEISMGKDRQEFPEPRTALVDDPDAPSMLELNAIVVKACARDRRERYQSAEDMHADLALLHSGRSVKRKHVLERRIAWMSKVGPVVTVLAVLATGAYLMQRRQTAEILRLASEEVRQRARAQSALALADENLVRLELQQAEQALTSDRAAMGLAELAHVLREHPTNQVAAERTVAALSQRNFLLPAIPSLHLSSPVSGLEFTSDGKLLFVACEDKRALLCDIRNGETRELPECEAVIDRAAFSADGQELITLGRDHIVRFSNVQNGQSSRPPITVARNSRFAEMTPAGSRLGFLAANRQIQVWDLQSNQLIGAPVSVPGELAHVCLSDDGESCLTITTDWRSQVWRSGTGQAQSPEVLCWLRVMLPSFSPDGRLVALGSEQKSARMRDAESLRVVGSALEHESWLTAIQFSPDSRRVATGSADRTTRVWDAYTGQSLTPVMRHQGPVQSVQFSPEGHRLLVVTGDNRVRVWDAVTGQPLAEPVETMAEIQLAQFSPDGTSVLVAANDGTVRVFDLRVARTLPRLLPNDAPLRDAEFSPDGSQVVTVNEGWTVWLWNWKKFPMDRVALRHWDKVHSADFSPDGSLLVTTAEDKMARVWKTATGKPAGKPFAHDAQVFQAQFDPSGGRIVTAAEDGKVRLWDLLTGRSLGEPMSHGATVTHVEFSRDGRRVVTSARDFVTRIWELNPQPRMLAEMRHEGYAGVVQSPDGLRFATFSADRTARIWDAHSGAPLSPALKHNTGITTADFSQDARRLVTGSSDGRTRIWDLSNWQSISGPPHEGGVGVSLFCPDGERVITGSDDGVARIWDSRSGQPLSENLEHRSSVRSAQFTRDGRWLVTGSDDGFGHIWEMPERLGSAPPWLAEVAEAVGGEKLDQQGTLVRTEDAGFWRVREAFRGDFSADGYASWAHWFVTPREQRPFTPHASITLGQLVDEYLQNDAPWAVEAALQLAPTDPEALARLAQLKFEANKNAAGDSGEIATAKWLSQYSAKQAPRSARVWYLRAGFLHETGDPRGTLAALERAIELGPQPEFWLMKSLELEALGDPVASGQSADSGLALASRMTDCPTNVLHKLLFQRINAWRQQGRQSEAFSELTKLKPFPARDANTASNCLDLTLCYNARFDEDWHHYGDKGNNLAGLSPGLHDFNGILFDARGIIQLTAALKELEPIYPDWVRGIAVQHVCRRIHFLHGTGWSTADGITLGYWIIHWADGRQESFPIVYGKDVRQWQFWPQMSPETNGASPVWQGTQARWKNWPGAGVRLYTSTWENPHPEVPIASIDYASAQAGSAPFLLAITLE